MVQTTGLIQRRRIRIPFSVVADLGDPISFPVVEYGKETGSI